MDGNYCLSMGSKVELPFKRARRAYNRISNWCIVISAGTLLWSMGNFEKFIVKATGNVTEYMPNKEVYIIFLGLFFLSTVIFTILRGYVSLRDYYDMRLRDIMEIEERITSKKQDQISPSQSEIKYFETIYSEYSDGYNKEHPKKENFGQTKWTNDLREKSISMAIADFGGESLHICKARINKLLAAGAICHLLGLIISIYYVTTFLLYYL